MCQKHLDTPSSFDRTPTCDGQMDGRSQSASIASRGKSKLIPGFEEFARRIGGLYVG